LRSKWAAGKAVRAGLAVRGSISEPIRDRSGGRQTKYLVFRGQDTSAESELGGKIHPELPYIGGEVGWAVREEMARTVKDVLARRTRALLLGARASIEAAPRGRTHGARTGHRRSMDEED
jgi:glycerol-3-phosphate dehydrogenase